MKHFLSRLITILFVACTMYAHEAGPSQPRTPQGRPAQPSAGFNIPGVILEEGEFIPLEPEIAGPAQPRARQGSPVAPLQSSGPAAVSDPAATASKVSGPLAFNGFRRLTVLTNTTIIPRSMRVTTPFIEYIDFADPSLYDLLQAISEECSPIVVSTPLFMLFLDLYTAQCAPSFAAAKQFTLNLLKKEIQNGTYDHLERYMLRDFLTPILFNNPTAFGANITDEIITLFGLWNVRLLKDRWHLLLDTKNHAQSVVLVPTRYVYNILNKIEPSSVEDEKLLGIAFSKFQNLRLPTQSPNATSTEEWEAIKKTVHEYNENAQNGSSFSLLFKNFYFNGSVAPKTYKWNIYLSGHGDYNLKNIAGIPQATFVKLLEQCAHQTNLLFYASCFGASQQHTTNVINLGHKIDYPIFSESITDAVLLQAFNKQLIYENFSIKYVSDILPLEKFFLLTEQKQSYEKLASLKQYAISVLAKFPGSPQWIPFITPGIKTALLSKTKLIAAAASPQKTITLKDVQFALLEYPIIPVTVDITEAKIITALSVYAQPLKPQWELPFFTPLPQPLVPTWPSNVFYFEQIRANYITDVTQCFSRNALYGVPKTYVIKKITYPASKPFSATEDIHVVIELIPEIAQDAVISNQVTVYTNGLQRFYNQAKKEIDFKAPPAELKHRHDEYFAQGEALAQEMLTTARAFEQFPQRRAHQPNQ